MNSTPGESLSQDFEVSHSFKKQGRFFSHQNFSLNSEIRRSEGRKREEEEGWFISVWSYFPICAFKMMVISRTFAF